MALIEMATPYLSRTDGDTNPLEALIVLHLLLINKMGIRTPDFGFPTQYLLFMSLIPNVSIWSVA